MYQRILLFLLEREKDMGQKKTVMKTEGGKKDRFNCKILPNKTTLHSSL